MTKRYPITDPPNHHPTPPRVRGHDSIRRAAFIYRSPRALGLVRDGSDRSIDRSIAFASHLSRARVDTPRRTAPRVENKRTRSTSRDGQKMFAQQTTAKIAPSAMRATASRGRRAVQARAGADRKMWCVRLDARPRDEARKISFRIVPHRRRLRSLARVVVPSRVRSLDGWMAHFPYLRISRTIDPPRRGDRWVTKGDRDARDETRRGRRSKATIEGDDRDATPLEMRDDGASIEREVNETTDGATFLRVGCRPRTRRRRTSTAPSPAITVSTRSAWAPTRNVSSTTKRRNS